MAARPNRSNQLLLSQGLAAHALATTHGARLTPRLGAGLVDGLAADLAALGALVPGALTARQQKKGATSTVLGSAAEVASLVAAIRASVLHSGIPAGSRKAWGVGQPVKARIVSSVLAAANLITSRAAAAPDEARAAGILAADLAALAAAATALAGKDSAQESSKLTSVQATKSRNAAARRIEDATKRIATAGMLEFNSEPDVAAEFAALLSAGGRKRPAAPKPATP